MMRLTSTYPLVTMLIALVVVVSGCSSWRGLNSLPVPGTVGGGSGSFTISAQLPDVVSIQQNSRVRVNDVTVGNVTKVERQGWHALVTMRLEKGVRLPANATAKVGQTSLLGSLHIELAAPTDTPPVGELRQGAVIPLKDAGQYPTTEQALASLSYVLNGGGLAQLQDVNQSLAQAFGGREDQLRDLVDQLDTLLKGLNAQRFDIISATESLDSLAGQVTDQDRVVDTALQRIPDALAVIAKQRTNLAAAATELGKFSSIATSTITRSRQALVANIRDLGPTLKSLADAGPALTRGLDELGTFPWVKDTLPYWIRGDYANLTGIIDLTLSRIDTSIFVGTPLEGKLTGLEAVLGRTVGIQPSPATRGNPLAWPYSKAMG